MEFKHGKRNERNATRVPKHRFGGIEDVGSQNNHDLLSGTLPAGGGPVLREIP
jgi:hypothetical protein